jgi:hypothetical protein
MPAPTITWSSRSPRGCCTPKALLRRSKPAATETLKFADLTLDAVARERSAASAPF